MFLATIVRDGRVVGTWKKGTRRTEGLVGTPFPEERLEAGTAQLQLRADAWARFHGLDGVPFSFAG
jgi:hypothetical protein